MAFQAGRVAVGTTPTAVFNAGDVPTRLIVKNAGAASVFLGGEAVTASDGYELAAGETLPLDASQDSSDDLYAVVTTAGPTLHYLTY